MSDNPATSHVYSPSLLTFYATLLRSAYQQSGKWPADAVEVSDETFETFGLNAPPEGMQRGADPTGQPIWVPLG